MASNARIDRVPTSTSREHAPAPVLEANEDGPARRFADAVGPGRPKRTFILGLLLVYALIAGLSICLGLLLTDVVLKSHEVATDDERVVDWLAGHRSHGLTDLSFVGSTMAGGVVLPILVGVVALAAAIGRHWRLAAFFVFALAVESGSYRATTLVVHRDRPDVNRLENLPVDASYPSGHTAASIAVYCGIALLLTSRIKNRAAQIAIWALALCVPPFVAWARMYRGMHHPLDVLGGVVVGVAAIVALVFVSRASGRAAETSEGLA